MTAADRYSTLPHVPSSSKAPATHPRSRMSAAAAANAAAVGPAAGNASNAAAAAGATVAPAWTADSTPAAAPAGKKTSVGSAQSRLTAASVGLFASDFHPRTSTLGGASECSSLVEDVSRTSTLDRPHRLVEQEMDSDVDEDAHDDDDDGDCTPPKKSVRESVCIEIKREKTCEMHQN